MQQGLLPAQLFQVAVAESVDVLVNSENSLDGRFLFQIIRFFDLEARLGSIC